MKKLLAVIIPIITAVAVIIGVCAYFGFDKVSAVTSTLVFSSDFSSDNTPLSTKNFEMLNDNEKRAYISIFNKIEKHPKYVRVPKLSSDEFNNVFFAVKNDNPDILCFSDSCNMLNFNSICLIELNYVYDTKECDKKRHELLDKVDEILAEAAYITDEYDKELYIHDYIASVCTYEMSSNASNAYGCLIDGKAVCSGYSRAVMLLLEYSGIESMLISGIGESELHGSISHMWNVVWIDGNPYHLDMTWDDPQSDYGDSISHTYFNLTTEEISVDHKEISPDIGCYHTEANYFLREGLHFDEYNSDTITQIQNKLTENVNNGMNYIELRFSAGSYEKAVSSLIDNSTPFSDMYKLIDCLKNSGNSDIDTTHVNFSKDDNNKYLRIMFDSN